MTSRFRATALVAILLQAGHVCAGDESPTAARSVQEAWARFEKAWTPSLDPMRPPGDPVWRLQYEALVLSVKTGKEAAPVLDEVVSNGSAASKEWAGQVRRLSRSATPEATATRRALADFDLAKLDSARYGEPAPDFELTDLTGKTWRLSKLRGQKNVALIFLGYAG